LTVRGGCQTIPEDAGQAVERLAFALGPHRDMGPRTYDLRPFTSHS